MLSVANSVKRTAWCCIPDLNKAQTVDDLLSDWKGCRINAYDLGDSCTADVRKAEDMVLRLHRR
jgi:hypothetical protein